MAFWIILGFIFIVFELGHPGAFLFLSFSIGSFLAYLVGFFHSSILLQSTVFLVGSLIGLKYLKYKYKDILKDKNFKTNSEALIGKPAIILKNESNKFIGVKVAGQRWSAKFDKELDLENDEIVVKEVKGSHLILGRKE